MDHMRISVTEPTINFINAQQLWSCILYFIDSALMLLHVTILNDIKIIRYIF